MSASQSQSLAAAPLLRRTVSGGVATLTLDDPASRNALSLAMIAALSGAVAALADDRGVRAVVLAAEGPVFSSGHDLREMAAHRDDRDGGAAFFTQLMRACAGMMQAIAALPQPVIAAVEGIATAAGCQLVATCDLAFAGECARFALPGVNVGLFCSTPLVAVARNVSRKHAMELALTGALYSAAEAERIGLVNRVVPSGSAASRALAMADDLASRSAATIAIGKRAFQQQIELGLGEAYELASRAMVENLLHPDADEGIGAFLQKRPPRWDAK
jgi:enoyl-CoA hydratase/carnithine racemase